MSNCIIHFIWLKCAHNVDNKLCYRDHLITDITCLHMVTLPFPFYSISTGLLKPPCASVVDIRAELCKTKNRCWCVQNEKFSLFISKFIKMTHLISVLQVVIQNKSDQKWFESRNSYGIIMQSTVLRLVHFWQYLIYSEWVWTFTVCTVDGTGLISHSNTNF